MDAPTKSSKRLIIATNSAETAMRSIKRRGYDPALPGIEWVTRDSDVTKFLDLSKKDGRLVVINVGGQVRGPEDAALADLKIEQVSLEEGIQWLRA